MEQNVSSAKKIAVGEKLIFLLFIIYPFAQLLKIDANIFGLSIPLYAIDVSIFILFLWFIYIKKLLLVRYYWFFAYLIFGNILSLDRFSYFQLIPGLLYLFRLYIFFHILFFSLEIFKSFSKKKLLKYCLITETVVLSIFGWIQYIIFPNLNFLSVFGWDRHLNRITSTLLDPNYFGLLIVFGLLLILNTANYAKHFRSLIIFFLFITLIFTFSRSSYLAFLFGIIFTIINDYRFKKSAVNNINIFKTLLLISIFISVFIFITKRNSEGENLFRTSSIVNRIDYFKKTNAIFIHYPLFGTGYNNLCIEKTLIFKYHEYNGLSHSCSGSDMSLFLLLTTTGITGLIALFVLIKQIIKDLNLKFDNESKGVILSIFIHSMFVNSMFYTPTIIYFLLYISLCSKNQRE